LSEPEDCGDQEGIDKGSSIAGIDWNLDFKSTDLGEPKSRFVVIISG